LSIGSSKTLTITGNAIFYEKEDYKILLAVGILLFMVLTFLTLKYFVKNNKVEKH